MAGTGTYIPFQLPATVNAAPDGRGTTMRPRWWRRFVAAMPLRFALLATAAVWAMGCVWSFREQELFAQAKGFHLPWLLPAVIDGLAIALACVAYAASLDGRPGVVARLGTAVAVAASAASNATFAWQRSGDHTTVVLAAGVPLAANLAFEVLLHELRRQVLRRRGLPAPTAVPYPRLIRVVLAPISTLRQWRRLVLDLTTLQPAPPVTDAAARASVPDASAPAAGVSFGAPASGADASGTQRADASAAPAPDASAPRTAAEPLTPDRAGATRADAPPAWQTAIGPAPADAATPQPTSPDTRRMIQTDARLHDRADADADADAAADAGARADADAAADAGARADADAAADADAVPDADAVTGADASPRWLRTVDADAEPRVRAAEAGALAKDARELYRASMASGDPLTGRQLGRMYNRSPSWGRERIGEVKAHDQGRAGRGGSRSTREVGPQRPAPSDGMSADRRMRAAAA